jgi:hypothetical protein
VFVSSPAQFVAERFTKHGPGLRRAEQLRGHGQGAEGAAKRGTGPAVERHEARVGAETIEEGRYVSAPEALEWDVPEQRAEQTANSHVRVAAVPFDN